MRKTLDYILLFLCVVILLMFYSVFIFGQNEISKTENRTLSKIEVFNMQEFINKNYQDNLEKAISDQILNSEIIKSKCLYEREKIVNKFSKIILKFKNNNESNYYVAVSNDIYTINNEDWLVYKYGKYDFDYKTINYFNNIKGATKYLYFIESDCSRMFNNDYYENIYDKIVNKVEDIETARLEVFTYEKYKEYYYKTDHHWNYRGQYQGYKDIAKLLQIPEEEQIHVTEEHNYNASFWGSKSKESSNYDFKDEWIVYKYNVKEPKTTYINGKEAIYGKAKQYDLECFKNDKLINHYGEYYGGDDAEIIFDYDAPKKENLLIISNSFSNSINQILAYHFNRTYIVDLRHYNNFEVNEYIKQNNINKVLILGNISLFGKETYFRNIDLDNFE